MILPPWLAGARAVIDGMGDRLPHALLVGGPGGCGEWLLAEYVARRILGLAGDRPLREVAHPDLRWVAAEEATIQVDQVRAVSDFLVQRPQRGPRKVVVIDQAERMNANAANALLKSLEEPPEESFLVLVTAAEERLLPTVRSRCQAVVVQPARQADALSWLAGEDVAEDVARNLMVEYGGAPYHVLDAVRRGQEPLLPALAAVRASGPALGEVAERLKDDNLADLLARWLRVVHRQLRRSGADRSATLDFADELLRLRQAAQVNTGLNRQMQIERLLAAWRDLPAGS